MEATPTLANRTDWRSSEPGAAEPRDEPSCAASVCTGMEPAGEATQQPRDALEIGGRGGHDVNPAVRIVDPVHRHFVDAQSNAFGQHQQLGVEEPPGVGDVREQCAVRRRRGPP